MVQRKGARRRVGSSWTFLNRGLWAPSPRDKNSFLISCRNSSQQLVGIDGEQPRKKDGKENRVVGLLSSLVI